MPLKHILLGLTVTAAFGQGLRVQVDGKPVGVENSLNLVPGIGIVHACVDNPGQRRVDCTPSFNTALIPTHDMVHANENYCVSTNRTIGYTCALPNKALMSYSAGMTFVLIVDTPCPKYCSLDIDRVGVKNLKKIDGTTDPGGELVAGQPQWIFYDGVVFRLMGGAGAASAVNSRGDVIARRVISAMDSLPYQPAMTLDVTAGDVHKIRTIPNGGNATLNAATAGLAGQHMWIIIANDNISAKTITFGANLLSTGPLAGVIGRSATIHFVSDGTAWYEVSRTVGL